MRYRKYPTIHELVERSVKEYPRKIAIRMPSIRGHRIQYRELTYAKLWDLSGRLGLWVARETSPGDRVAIISKPGIGWAVTFFAALRAGAVVTPLDAELQRNEIARILREAEVKFLFVNPKRFEELEDLTEEIHTLKGVYSLEREAELPSIWDLIPDEVIEPANAKPDPEELALLMYTSGTTGDSKGVMLSHRNITSNVLSALEVINVSYRDRIISIVPWYHIYGLTFTLIAPLTVGATTMYTDDYRNLMEIARRSKFTILIGVPKLFHTMWRRIEENIRVSFARRLICYLAPKLIGKALKKKLLSPEFRFFVSGGAPLDPKVAKGLRRMGLGIIQGYGLTETSPLLTLSSPFDRKAATVGKPIPGVEIKIENPGPDGYGEVLARGPNVMMGYYRNPKRTAEVLTEDGWFRTGDLGKLDWRGRLYLAGRKKNVIVLESGKNVYPEEVEAELSRIPEIEEVMVYEAERKGTPVVAALIYPNWERLQEEGITDKAQAKDLIWERIREAQRNLAVFKRIKSKEDIDLVERPFAKSTKQEIKRHLYVKKRT